MKNLKDHISLLIALSFINFFGVSSFADCGATTPVSNAECSNQALQPQEMSIKISYDDSGSRKEFSSRLQFAPPYFLSTCPLLLPSSIPDALTVVIRLPFGGSGKLDPLEDFTPVFLIDNQRLLSTDYKMDVTESDSQHIELTYEVKDFNKVLTGRKSREGFLALPLGPMSGAVIEFK